MRKNGYMPYWADEMPQKINVKLSNGKIVSRSVQWYNFLPDWLTCDGETMKEPYVVINNQPAIICTAKTKSDGGRLRITGLITLEAWLKHYGVELLTASGHHGREWWKHIDRRF